MPAHHRVTHDRAGPWPRLRQWLRPQLHARTALLAVALIAGVVTLAVASLIGLTAGPRVVGAAVAPHRSTTVTGACTRPAPTTAGGYAALFAGLAPREWGGGDVAITAPLGGRTVWLFGDTVSTGRLVHSSAVVQRGGCLHVSHGGAQLLPDDRVTRRPTPADPSVIYWIAAARAAGPDSLTVTARAIQLVGTGPWDFRDAGYSRTALVTIDANGDVTFRRWVAITPGPAPDPGRLIDCEAPAAPVAHHVCYARQLHPDLRLAGGRELVTVSQNWDDGVLRPLVDYQPLFRSG